MTVDPSEFAFDARWRRLLGPSTMTEEPHNTTRCPTNKVGIRIVFLVIFILDGGTDS